MRGNHWKGSQSDFEAEAKSLRPASLLMLLFLGPEIRHTVSKATTFYLLERRVDWGLAYEILIKMHD